ncbi:MAG: hypothetical protein CSA72_10965 [Rhodobacterales bacterium]|nr:MAG: hypothetical protein CSA72_10965 [Rhodobacterales bacterium]
MPRQRRGATNYLAGAAAEEIVARRYGLAGHAVVAQRWRGRSGEIDLILQDGAGLIFVEVKKSKSFEAAIARVTQRQARRIMRAATEYVAGQPRGQLTDMRFDIAAVDGQGGVQIVENAFWGID